MSDWVGVVLAAGEGRRMNSKIPKVLHHVGGKPMISHVVEGLKQAGIERVLVVVSPNNAEPIRNTLGDSIEYVAQPQPLGTGHAVMQCVDAVATSDVNLLVTMGDAPLIRPDTFTRLMSRHLRSDAVLTMLAARGSEQQDLGRIRRDTTGSVRAIVEAADAEGVDLRDEVNAGVYCLDGSWLNENVGRIPASSNGEYYLTWLVEDAASQRRTIETVTTDNAEEIMGVNDRITLAAAEAAMRLSIAEKWMKAGVTIIDPSTTYIDADVVIGRDSVIHPNSHLQSAATIGNDCVIGPGAMIRGSGIGDRCRVLLSVVEESTLENDVDVGPYSHLRPGCHVESGTHVGNFVEVKASRLGKGVKLGHFGYVGDAEVGANANLGAGLVTCNFDGARKHKTKIGEDAFIGSDTMLVAPVSVGKGAATGAGAVVNTDVPPYRLAVGVPARIIERSPDRASGDPVADSNGGDAG